MRFIAIETARSGNVIINPDNITSISKSEEQSVMLSLGGYEVVYTKFTDIGSAVDYIQRAPSVSLEEATQLKGKHIPGGV
jgi:hypothetical protein